MEDNKNKVAGAKKGTSGKTTAKPLNKPKSGKQTPANNKNGKKPSNNVDNTTKNKKPVESTGNKAKAKNLAESTGNKAKAKKPVDNVVKKSKSVENTEGKQQKNKVAVETEEQVIKNPFAKTKNSLNEELPQEDTAEDILSEDIQESTEDEDNPEDTEGGIEGAAELPDDKKLLYLKKEKKRKILMIVGFVICAIAFISAIVTTVVVTKLNVVPVKYIVLVDIVVFIFLAWFVIMQQWVVPGIVAKIIAILMSIGMIFGSFYMNYTYKSIKKITGVVEKVDRMCVFVMADNPAESLIDAKDYNFGVLTDIDHDNTVNFKENIEKELKQKIQVKEYDYVLDLVGGLYKGEVDAILLNGSYSGFAASADEFIEFDTDTKIIYSQEIVSKVTVEKEKNENYLAPEDEGEVFTLYISGIDTRGSSPKVNSNSDVNILMTVNTKTRQILLISTPRDFYVPLSISGGVRDKLTHAGGHGIDVSVATLEMLYEVNIDDYLKINFTGFIDVIDALGGVTVHSDYSFQTLNGDYYIEAGMNECDGAKALAFARERYSVPGGDRTRGKDQMTVIEALIKKMASSQLLNNYTEILDSLSDSMVTSMTYEEISELIKFQLNDMRDWDIVKYSADGADSSGPTYSAGSQILYVMEPYQETVDQAKEYLKQIYNNQKVVLKEETTESTSY